MATDNKRTRGFWGDPIDPVGKSAQEHFGRTVAAAMGARSTLLEMGFNPGDRRMEAVKARKGTIPPDQLARFLEAYMTAFFVTGAPPDGGLTYEYDFVGKQPIDTFFGNPPGADQLPDGRCIIDCKGFSAVSQLLFRELSGSDVNAKHSTHFTYQFGVYNHHMSLICADKEVMAVDNSEVTRLPLSAAERDHLHGLHAATFVRTFGGYGRETVVPLGGRIDLRALPTLAAFIQEIRLKYSMGNSGNAVWGNAIAVMQ